MIRSLTLSLALMLAPAFAQEPSYRPSDFSRSPDFMTPRTDDYPRPYDPNLQPRSPWHGPTFGNWDPGAFGRVTGR